MNSTGLLIATNQGTIVQPLGDMEHAIRSLFRGRPGHRGLRPAARTTVETRRVQTVHGSNCICHRCRRG